MTVQLRLLATVPADGREATLTAVARASERERPARSGTGAAVAIDGVTVSFPQPDGTVVEAVRDATLDIEPGSIVSLLGPSGCGKTSLLRAIAGLERPTAGTITVGGTVVSDRNGRGGVWVHPERRSVGMVFQDGALFPHLSVAENIAFGLRTDVARMTRTQRSERVAEMLRLIGLADLADRLPDTLSGGQQQRVALARSLAPQPSVLLLDEPFSALDAALRVQVRADVADIVRAVGVTTIFVTHDQDEAFVLGDRVAVLRDGRIEQTGTPDVLYRHPRTPWIAGFVGEANFVAGRFDITSATHVQTPIGPVPLSSGDSIREAADVDVVVPVDVLVRPEQLVLDAAPEVDTAGSSGDTIADRPVTGNITSIEYYGHDVRYEVLLADGSTLAARTQSPELLTEGQAVTVRYIGQPTEAWPRHP